MKINKIIQESMQDVHNRCPILIAFLGDSVTQGCFELYNAREKGYQTEFRNECGYQVKLQNLFDMVFPQASISMLNAGSSGDSAPNGAKRVQRDVIDFHPQLAVVCFGLNDSGRGLAHLEEYAEGLQSIFQQLKAAEIDVIFMTPNMKATYPSRELNLEDFDDVIESNYRCQTDGTMDRYMERAREVCAMEGIPVCDCYEKWKKINALGADVTHLLANKVNHPNEKMHWIFAWSLFEMILGL